VPDGIPSSLKQARPRGLGERNADPILFDVTYAMLAFGYTSPNNHATPRAVAMKLSHVSPFPLSRE